MSRKRQWYAAKNPQGFAYVADDLTKTNVIDAGAVCWTDAVLIASVDDLLAACRCLLEVIEPNDVPGSRTNVAIKLARDAIRKAGQTAPDSAP